HNLPTIQIRDHFEKGEYGRDENHPCRKYYGHYRGFYPYNLPQSRRRRNSERTVGEENIGEDKVAGAPLHHYPKEESEEFQKEEKAWQEEEAEEEEVKKEVEEERRELFSRKTDEASDEPSRDSKVNTWTETPGKIEAPPPQQQINQNTGEGLKQDSSGGFISSSGQRYMVNPMYNNGYGGYPYGGYPGYGGYGGYDGLGAYGGFVHPFSPYGMHPCAWHGGFYPFPSMPPLHGYSPDSVNAIHSAVHKMSPSSSFNFSTREKR
ncbi:hypothetical protein PENTCL1PPCAC_17191, partial [Pristionchus entomophagus]